MAIIEQTRAYETLIRHNEGGGIGAHHVTITEVVKDGLVIAASTNPPVPIYGAELEEVIGTAVLEAVAHSDQLRIELSSTQNQVETLGQQLAEITQEKNEVVAGRDGLAAELEAASELVASLRAQVDLLKRQLVAATLSGGAQES